MNRFRFLNRLLGDDKEQLKVTELVHALITVAARIMRCTTRKIRTSRFADGFRLRIAAQFERMRAIFQQAYPHLGDDAESPVLVLAQIHADRFSGLYAVGFLQKDCIVHRHRTTVV